MSQVAFIPMIGAVVLGAPMVGVAAAGVGLWKLLEASTRPSRDLRPEALRLRPNVPQTVPLNLSSVGVERLASLLREGSSRLDIAPCRVEAVNDCLFVSEPSVSRSEAPVTLAEITLSESGQVAMSGEPGTLEGILVAYQVDRLLEHFEAERFDVKLDQGDHAVLLHAVSPIVPEGQTQRATVETLVTAAGIQVDVSGVEGPACDRIVRQVAQAVGVSVPVTEVRRKREYFAVPERARVKV